MAADPSRARLGEHSAAAAEPASQSSSLRRQIASEISDKSVLAARKCKGIFLQGDQRNNKSIIVFNMMS
jgi:hypothetical protein